MILFFSRAEAKKICKPGQVNYTSQHFHVKARGKFNSLRDRKLLSLLLGIKFNFEINHDECSFFLISLFPIVLKASS